VEGVEKNIAPQQNVIAFGPTVGLKADIQALAARFGEGEVDAVDEEFAIANIAKRHGASVVVVRRAYAAERKKQETLPTQDDKTTSPTTLAFTVDPEPAATPNPLAAIFDGIVKVIRARVHCSQEVADGVALWAAASWGVFPPHDPDSGPDLFPFCHIGAPTWQCGKTTFLETVQHFMRRPLQAASVSAAALYRVIEKYRPAMMVDEFDRLIKTVPELIGILNSAHTRSGQVIRAVEVQANGIRSFEPQAFSTYTPIFLAGIGAAPPTIADRSIRVRLQRQPRGRRQRRVGHRNLRGLRDQLTPHLMAHADAIGLAAAKGVPDSAIPPTLNDRDADNWRPLLAVATLAGGTWPGRAYRAAAVLCEDSAAGDRGAEWSLRQVVEAIEEKRREVVTEYLAWRRAGKPKPARAPALGPKGVQRPPYFSFIPSDDLAAWLLNKDDSGFGDLRDIGAVKLRAPAVQGCTDTTQDQRAAGPGL
jgi:putative DNA primase/helicase